MPDSQTAPIVIEEKFQQMKYRLAVLLSGRLKIIYLMNFFNLLNQKGNPLLYQSYYQELLPYMIENITEETLQFRTIKQLLQLKEILHSFSVVCSQDSETDEFQSAQATCRRMTAKTYFYLSEWREGMSILWYESKLEVLENIFSGFGSSNNEHFLETFNRLTSLMSEIEDIPVDVQEELKRIYNDWQQTHGNSRDDCIWTLLIEQPHGKNDNDRGMSLGTIQPLCLKLSLRPVDARDDLFMFNNKTISFNDLIHQQTQDVLTAVRNVFFNKSSRNDSLYRALYAFPEKESFYTGDSLGLAMGLLSVAALSFLETKTCRFKLRQDAAVTGPLDMLGNVRPMAEQALKTKLETVFFSPFQTIVLPEQNRSNARSILKTLQHKHPNRKLSLKFTQTLEHCLNDGDIVVQEKISLADKFVNKSNKKYRLAVMAVMVLLFIWGVKFVIERDVNPAKLEVRGKYMTVYNSAEKELWKYEFDHEIADENNFKTNINTLADFIVDDLEGDGKNEVILGTHGNQKKELDGAIFYFNSNGTLKWRFHDHRKLKFGGELMDDFYNIRFILHHDFEEDGEPEIVAVFGNYPWYPCRLVIMDIQGNIKKEYWNSGYIDWVIFADINDDGIDEIIFSGTNNDYDQAVVGVLEYSSLAGHSPQDDPNYIPREIPAGQELHYLRFPTLHPKFLDLPENARLHARQITNLGNGQFEVKVNSGFPRITHIYYTINNKMFVEKIGYSDGFLQEYFRITGRNLFDLFDQDTVTEYLSNLEYWNSGEWVSGGR